MAALSLSRGAPAPGGRLGAAHCIPIGRLRPRDPAAPRRPADLARRQLDGVAHPPTPDPAPTPAPDPPPVAALRTPLAPRRPAAAPLRPAPAAARRARAAPPPRAAGDGALAPATKETAVLSNACVVLAALAALKGLAGAAAPAELLARSLGHGVEVPLNTALAGAATAVCWAYAAWFLALRVRARARARARMAV
jgi:hypothetical protein